MMKRILLILTILTATVATMVAQSTSFDVQTPRNVVEGSRFSLTFSLKNGENATAPQAPQLEGCTMLFGPATSTMQSYQVVNGRASSSTSTDYTFTYRADKAGTVEIPSVTITSGGKKYSSRQVSFSILPPDSSSQGAAQGGGGSATQRNRAQAAGADFNVSAKDVIVRIILSRSQAYEQEAIECTIKLYTKYNISSFLVKTQPSFDGFLIEDLNVQSYIGEREHYNGENYYTAILKRCILYPQKSGTLNINSGQYDLTVERQIMINNWPFPPHTSIEEKQLAVNSNSASIVINPLPMPQPEGFTGAVGKFSIDSRLVGNSFKTNEAATLIYTITGTGNIKYIHEPAIDFPSEFELYAPRSESNTRVAGNNMTGTMTVEYTFVPQSVGKFNIGADKFVYFDPSTKDYVTLTTPSYDLNVEQGAVVASSGSSSAKQEILSKNTDIHHIKLGDKNPSLTHSYIVNAGWYWPVYVVLAAVLAAIIYLYAKSAREAANVTGRKLARANKVARKRLKAAQAFLHSRSYEQFYAELLRAMWGYFGDKLSIPASQLSRDNISTMLSDYGAPQQLTDDLVEVLDECEMARYTPQQSPEKAESVFTQASSVINRMEELKRTQRS